MALETITLVTLDTISPPTSPDAFIQYWESIFAKIPKDAINPVVELTAGQYWGEECLELEVTYEREIPPETVAKLKAAEVYRLSQVKKRELNTLRRLKAKYETD